MANPPTGSNPSDEPNEKPSASDPSSKLPEWLSTDDWLQVTPQPKLSGPVPVDSVEFRLPEQPDEPQTEMIEVPNDDDDASLFGTARRDQDAAFGDVDESVLLTDEFAGPKSQVIRMGEVLDFSPDPDQPPSSQVLLGGHPPRGSTGPDTPVVAPDDDVQPDVAVPGSSYMLEVTGPPSTVSLPPLAPVAVAPTVPLSTPELSSISVLPTTGVRPAPVQESPSSIQPVDLGTVSSVNLPGQTPPPMPMLPTSDSDIALPPMPGGGLFSSPDLQLPDFDRPALPSLPDDYSDVSYSGSDARGLPLPKSLPNIPPVRFESSLGGPSYADMGTLPSLGDLSLPSSPQMPNLEASMDGGIVLPPTGPGQVFRTLDDIDLPEARAPKLTESTDDMIDVSGFVTALPDPELDDAEADIGTPIPPTTAASGWLPSTTKLPKPVPQPIEPVMEEWRSLNPSLPLPPVPGSEVDIVLPPTNSDEASDIFTTAGKPGDRTGGSGLYTGARTGGVDEFLESLPGHPPGESSLLSGLDQKPAQQLPTARPPGASVPRDGLDSVSFELPRQGSKTGPTVPMGNDDQASELLDVDDNSIFDALVSNDPTRRVPHEALPGEFDDLRTESELNVDDLLQASPDMDFLDRQSGSNLHGDRTLSEADLDDALDVPFGPSGNLSGSGTGGGPNSNIFERSSSIPGGAVDIDSIPLMGSSDESAGGRRGNDPSDLLLDPVDDDDDASVFDMPPAGKSPTQDSGKIDWSDDPNTYTDRLGTQPSAAVTPPPRSQDGSGPAAMLPPVVSDPTTRTRVQRPVVDVDDTSAPRKRGGLLTGAAGLLAGLGVGAGGMFFLGGSGGDSTKSSPVADAGQAAMVQKLQNDLKARSDELTQATELIEKAKQAGGDNSALTAAKEKAEAALQSEKKKAADAEQQLKKVEKQQAALLDQKAEADKKATAAATALADAQAEKTKLAADLTTATTQLAESGKKLESADKQMTTVQAALAPLVDKLKSANVLDPKAEPAAVLAGLPDALKKVAIVPAEGSDVAKLTRQIEEKNSALKLAEQKFTEAVTTGEKKLQAAMEATDLKVKTATADAQKKVQELTDKLAAADTTTKTEVEKAVAAEKLAAEAARKQDANKLATLTAEVGRNKEQFQRDLKAVQDDFQAKLEQLRKGVTILPTPTETARTERATNSYATGVTAYFNGNYTDAETALASATQTDGTDARAWYFLGLAKLAGGRSAEAESDFRKGAELETQGKPRRRDIGAALERVQGAARRVVESYRPQ
jgi:hypothetical protein